MFALVNDGDTVRDLMDPLATQRLLCHRVFLFDLLTTGLALALLDGAEFRDSKVSDFACSSRTESYLVSPIRYYLLSTSQSHVE